MHSFMDNDFLLNTPTAKTLYHDYAAQMPIIDYHCHVDPKEIYENRHFQNISQLWLESDHYKWRVMRSNGIQEQYITGDASERDKFLKFAETLPKAIGNPMYHWCHMELQTYFGYEGVLNGETDQEVWALCEKKLAAPDMGVRDIISKSNVAFVGTTDDPADSLQWHKKLAEDTDFQPVVAPSFRPDKALNIEKEGWQDYLNELGNSAGITIDSLDALERALSARILHFDSAGCRAADHGLEYVPYQRLNRNEINQIYQKRLNHAEITAMEVDAFKTHLLLFCAAQYVKYDWVMQLHFNCVRNPNSAMFLKLGPDAGFDCMGSYQCAGPLYNLLDTLYAEKILPKTVLYSLNPGDNDIIGTMIGAFQGEGVPGKVQQGSAWWFNDHKTGMVAQLTSLANLGLLGNFVGMLTDSRSFLSYARHAYFRRILCNLIGAWIENGEYLADIKAVGLMVQDICCNNAKRYFRI